MLSNVLPRSASLTPSLFFKWLQLTRSPAVMLYPRLCFGYALTMFTLRARDREDELLAIVTLGWVFPTFPTPLHRRHLPPRTRKRERNLIGLSRPLPPRHLLPLVESMFKLRNRLSRHCVLSSWKRGRTKKAFVWKVPLCIFFFFVFSLHAMSLHEGVKSWSYENKWNILGRRRNDSAEPKMTSKWAAELSKRLSDGLLMSMRTVLWGSGARLLCILLLARICIQISVRQSFNDLNWSWTLSGTMTSCQSYFLMLCWFWWNNF